MMGEENSLQTHFQREDYLHLRNYISSNSASFVPNYLCIHLFQGNQEHWPLKMSMCHENEMPLLFEGVGKILYSATYGFLPQPLTLKTYPRG